MGEERIKRPKLGRTGPVRSWSTLFTAPGTGAPGVEPTASRQERSMGDVVSRSVELGYRVIDEYIRQGQKAAQRLGDRSYGAATMTSDASEFATRMTQYASDFTALWFEFLQTSGIGLTPRPPIEPSVSARASSPVSSPSPAAVPPSPPSAGPEAPLPAEMLRLKVAVVSPYPTEVSLDLRQKATNGRVSVQSLRADDAHKPRLSDVAVEDSDGAMVLRIRVPESQPAGIYTGLIVDESTSLPIGTVSLHITRE